jgi:hypothetical protein
LLEKGEKQMVIYEVYLCGNDEKGELSGETGELIGVLPERRVNRDRIDSDSMMKWSRTLFGNALNTDELCFVQKTI